MAFTSGVATGPLDLFNKLKEFILDGVNGAGWSPAIDDYIAADYAGYRTARTNNTASVIYTLIDGSTNSYITWYTYHYYDFEFFEDKTIASIKLSMPDFNTGTTLQIVDHSPIRIVMQTSPDGVAWTTVGDWNNLSEWTDLEVRELTLASPVTTRWVRLTMPTARTNDYSRAGEVQFIEPGGPIWLPSAGRYNARFYAKTPFTATGISARVAILLCLSDPEDYYSIGIWGATDLSPTTDLISEVPRVVGTYGSSPAYVPIWDAAIPYWFYGNERYIYAFVKVGSTYRQLGAGYMLAYATPAQWPFPFFVGGETTDLTYPWDADSNPAVRGFTSPGTASLFMFNPQTNSWVTYSNFYSSGSTEYQQNGSHMVWPTSYPNVENRFSINADNSSYSLLPLVMFKKDEQIYGEMQNLYYIPGGTLTSEDTVTIDGQVYRVFQNGWRTSIYDYCAVKEI